MKQIPLTKGLFAIVDDEDYEDLIKHKWYASRQNKNFFYAKRDILVNGKKKRIYMHRQILRLYNRFDVVDHIDGNPLNNSRCNLRICTQAQNMRNIKSRCNKFGYKGVSKNGNKYTAKVNVNGIMVYWEGCFCTPEAAARAYDEAAKIHHGEFANLNFP